jgi:hypothetical protein
MQYKIQNAKIKMENKKAPILHDAGFRPYLQKKFFLLENLDPRCSSLPNLIRITRKAVRKHPGGLRCVGQEESVQRLPRRNGPESALASSC